MVVPLSQIARSPKPVVLTFDARVYPRNIYAWTLNCLNSNAKGAPMNGTQGSLSLQFARVVSHRTGELHESPREFGSRMKVWIYGLFDSSGLCHYVGQTNDPVSRWKTHCLDSKSKFCAEKRTLQMRLIRHCQDSASARLETQIVSAYKRRSQCCMNAILPRPVGRTAGPLIYSRKENRFFTGHLEAAKYFRYSVTSIISQLNGKRENYFSLVYV